MWRITSVCGIVLLTVLMWCE